MYNKGCQLNSTHRSLRVNFSSLTSVVVSAVPKNFAGGHYLPKRRIALLIETSSGYGRSLLAGVSRFIQTRQEWTVFFSQRDLDTQIPQWISNWDGDGIISRQTTPELSEAWKRKGMAVVDLTDGGQFASTNEFPTIRADDAAIARAAADHLMEQGHRHFAFCGFDNLDWSARRGAAFESYLRGQNLNLHASYSTPCNANDQNSWSAGCEMMARWAKQLPKPVGIFAANDIRGHEVITACRLADVAVPEQVSVIGVDNDEVACKLSEVPLSSVKSDIERIGYDAALALSRLLNKDSVSAASLVSPIGIAARQSTDVLAVGDAVVVKALRYIREHACNGITVTDIAEHCSISRSTLERRMKSAIQRAPQQQIRHMQLARVCELLMESQQPFSAIASLCGFEHPEYMHVAFKRKFAMTPGEFRRANSGV